MEGIGNGPAVEVHQEAGRRHLRPAGWRRISPLSVPALSTVLLWVVDGKHEAFSEQYHVAREAAGYAHADEALDMRHAVISGEVDAQAARVVLDALKWGAERMSPKKHSPRQMIDHSSPDGSMTPQPTRIEIVAPNDNGKS